MFVRLSTADPITFCCIPNGSIISTASRTVMTGTNCDIFARLSTADPICTKLALHSKWFYYIGYLPKQLGKFPVVGAFVDALFPFR